MVRDAFIPYRDTPPSRSEADGKRRPIIVFGWSDFGPDKPSTILVVPVTTHGNGGRVLAGEVPITEPDRVGLRENSHAQPGMIIALHAGSIDLDATPQGYIADHDFKAVVAGIAHMFVATNSLLRL